MYTNGYPEKFQLLSHLSHLSQTIQMYVDSNDYRCEVLSQRVSQQYWLYSTNTMTPTVIHTPVLLKYPVSPVSPVSESLRQMIFVDHVCWGGGHLRASFGIPRSRWIVEQMSNEISDSGGIRVDKTQVSMYI